MAKISVDEAIAVRQAEFDELERQSSTRVVGINRLLDIQVRKAELLRELEQLRAMKDQPK